MKRKHEKIRQGVKLFEDFTGHEAKRALKMAKPVLPDVMIRVGEVLAIAYITTRDGKKESYEHQFKKGSRPLLAASSDGRVIALLGGSYRFTESGINDRKI